MNREDVGAVGRAIEDVGSLVLLLVLVAVMWRFGGYLANGIDNFFRLGPDFSGDTVTLPGIELGIVPLAAITAARLRFGVDRILVLRASRVRIWLPLLMATSLFGLVAYLVWTWQWPQAALGLQLGLGPLRWLGIVLLAVFTWVWMPLFPRVTATWAGMIAGPALFAIIGYSFFPECMPEHVVWERAYPAGLIIVSPMAMLFWAGGALLLWARSRTGTETQAPSNPLHFAVWSGAIMLALSLIGTLSFTAC